MNTVGFKVCSTRLLNKIPKSFNNKWANQIGESQNPRFRECAVQYLKSIKVYEKEREKGYLPPEIYSEGKDILEQDANARINYARYINADMMVTIDATAYITDPGMEAVCNKFVGSERLATLILDEVSKRTRSIVKGVSYVEDPGEIKHNSLFPGDNDLE